MAVRATYGHVRRCDRIDMIVRVAGKEYTAAGFRTSISRVCQRVGTSTIVGTRRPQGARLCL